MLDIGLLRKEVAWVEEQEKKDAEEREWRQGLWFTNEEVTAKRVEVQYRHEVLACTCSECNPTYDAEAYQADLKKELTLVIKEGVCGSHCCVAGHIVLNHGTDEQVVDAVLHEEKWQEHAEAILGLPPGGSEIGHKDDLFAGENNAEDIRRIAEKIAVEHGEKL